MPQSADIGKLAEALAAAQAEIKAPKKGRTGKIKGTTKDGKPYEYEYHYADLADVIECRRAGAKHGLAITQGMEMREGYLALTTVLMHSSGQWKEWECPIPAGLKPQELGSYLTYMRRYSECGAWGIAAEDDDDGKGAQDAPTTPTRKPEPKAAPAAAPPQLPIGGLNADQIASVHVAAKRAGYGTVRDLAPVLKNIVGVERAAEIPVAELNNVLEHLSQIADERGSAA